LLSSAHEAVEATMEWIECACERCEEATYCRKAETLAKVVRAYCDTLKDIGDA
jgi:hypothetical protein